MKQWWRYLLSVTVALLVFAPAAHAGYWDKMDSYDVDLRVNTDGTVDVHEVIVYNFGDVAPAHGIERYIPTTYTNQLFNEEIGLNLHRVTDADGYDWPVNTYRDNGYVVWRIGSATTTVTGEQTYVLDYTVDWVLTDYTDYVELYWDAIGTEWNVPIDEAHIRVTVPPNSAVADYPPLCYFGSYGDTSTCDFSADGNTYSADVYSLDAYQGVSIIFAFAPGTVQLHSVVEYWMHWLWANWALLLIPGWVLLAMVLLFLNRRIKPTKPLIPIYEIPAGITTPSAAEYLLTGKITQRAFAGELVELARVGELEFIYNPDKGEVKSLKSTGNIVRNDAAAVLLRSSLFSRNTEIELRKTVVTSSAFLITAKKDADALMRSSGWIDAFKKMMKTCTGIYALAGFVFGGLMMASSQEGALRHLIIAGAVFMAFGLLTFFIQGSRLPLNVAGANQRQLVEGFKWFLSVTETERLKFNQVPKLTPKMFEDYLPYAIAFGVEKQWVKQFENILQEPPAWMHGVNQALLYNALLSTGRVPTQFKVPVSARSGGSGFSGGGFSGGGFGGGGGGRW